MKPEDFKCKYCCESGCSDTNYHEQELIKVAKQEVFDDMRKLWQKCQNHDLRGLMLNDIKEMEEYHLSTFATQKKNNNVKKNDKTKI